MGNWEARTKNSGFDANAAGTGAMSARDAQRSGANVNSSFGYQPGVTWYNPFTWGNQGVDGQTAQSMGGYSIVGIDATKVDGMRNQIRTSVTAVQNYLDGIDATVDAAAAFRSEEIVTAVQGYVNSVKEYSKALISDLLAFSDKLQDVKEAWEASSQSFASDSIDTNTSSMSDATTYYTEQK